MRLLHPDPAAGLFGLRAMKTIASAAGPMGPSQRAVMEAAKKVILHLDADIDALSRSRRPSWRRAFRCPS